MFDHVIQWKIRLWSYSFFHIDDVFKNNGLNFQSLSPLHGANYDDYNYHFHFIRQIWRENFTVPLFQSTDDNRQLYVVKKSLYRTNCSTVNCFWFWVVCAQIPSQFIFLFVLDYFFGYDRYMYLSIRTVTGRKSSSESERIITLSFVQ